MLADFSGLSAEQIAQLSPDELAELAELIERARAPKNINDYFADEGALRRDLYPVFLEFFAAGDRHQERALIAANRVGKSATAAYELTLHCCGRYPDWWVGRRFNRPIVAWACGSDVKTLRDSVQKILLGPPEARGSGMILPADLLKVTPRGGGVADAADSIYVRHQSGGTSSIVLKSYDSQREAFQAAKVDAIWLDEEPSLSVYSECLTRTMSTTPGEPSGVLFATFTPLNGISSVVLQYLPGGILPTSEAERLQAWGW